MYFESGTHIWCHFSPIAIIHESGNQGVVSGLTSVIIRSNVFTEVLLTVVCSTGLEILLSVVAWVTKKAETERKSYLLVLYMGKLSYKEM